MTNTWWTTAAAALGVVALAAGCANDAGDLGDKSGGPDPITELVLASNDGVDLDGAPAVQHFVDTVSRLSGGKLRVRLEPRWQGGNNEPRVIRDVAAGRAELGWSGTRAFDLMGVNSLAPLHAPFLVDSYPLQADVVRKGSQRLLAGVPAAGVTPLALTADELRFPAGVAKPILDPSDWKGLAIRTVSSRSQAAAIEALAAKPVLDGDISQLIHSGSVDAVETMWWTYQGQGLAGSAPYVTANVALWPRTAVIFANPTALKRLPQQQRGWINAAADDASRWSTEHATDRIQQNVSKACKVGARIAMASPAQLAALRSAAEPAYAKLRTDAEQADILNWISSLKTNQPPPKPISVPPGCAYHPGDDNRPPRQAELATPGATGSFPLGTYRYTLTVEEILATGAPSGFATENAGVWTWMMGKGVFELTWKSSESSTPTYPCSGYYTIAGNTATFTRKVNQPTGDCVPPTWTAQWTASGDTVKWSGLHGDFNPVFTTKPWQKID